MSEHTEIVIGRFYETPDGLIARTFGWTGHNKTIRYYFDDNGGSYEVHVDVFQTSWKPRFDLEDFPNARDPRLPPAFDLCWDVKHRSELVRLLAQDGDEKALHEAMVSHGIVLTEEEMSHLEEIRANARACSW
jgi:hypothetical protein